MTSDQINVDSMVASFFSGLGIRLGLTDALVQRLREGETVLGPAGMLCCVHAQPRNDGVSGFPEVILPLAARELEGDEVVTLLALQEQLLTEYGWRLTMSNLGLLCICPLLLAQTPEDVAAALERGQIVARVVLDALVTQAGSAREAVV
ncbi:Hpa3 family type III secretion system protein [Xanthomonas euvesicatoria]|uniref:Hpa3 family type III secretion system protein n=1 Tax=Xanthomonas euvesicatoria TaxID=456327 RepID=UPI003A1016CC